jgi:uncharacterized membrane protein YbhN (UPF0104 family)
LLDPELTVPVETELPGLAAAGSYSAARVGRLLSWSAGVLGLLTLILVVLHAGSLERSVELARSAHGAWLFVAVMVQTATYVSAAMVWRQALRRAGHPLPLHTLVPLGIAKVFTDQALPSGGIGGTMLAVVGLIRRRVAPEAAMAAMLASLVSRDIAYLIVVLTSLGILWLRNRANLPLLIGVAVFVVVTVASPAVVLALKRWGDRAPPVVWLGKLLGMSGMFRALSESSTDLLRSPTLLAQTVVLQLAIFLLDALTLWLIFHAIGDAQAVWVVFVSFSIASMVATIGPIPVGLGTFEATSVAMLSRLGVSVEAALAGTLLLRGLTFWLPMLPGVWLARREISGVHHRP